MASQPRDQYATKPLTAETWDDFAALVEANNGVWGGCWCIGFHPEGITKDSTAEGNREAKRAHVANGTVHQMLVYRGDECVGWIQYGPPAEVATIKNPKAYEKELVDLPDWRIGCVFTGSRHRGEGVARAGLAGVLECHRPGRWRHGRGLPRAAGGARTAARRLPAHRAGDPVRGVRLRP